MITAPRAPLVLMFVFSLSMGTMGPAIPVFQDAFGLGYSGAALNLTMFSIGALVGGATVGFVRRVVPRFLIVVFSLAGIAVGAILIVTAPVAWFTYLGSLVMGLFGVTSLTVGQAVLGEMFPTERVVSLSRGHLLAGWGLLAGAAAVAFGRLIGMWRITFVIPLVIALVVVVAGTPRILPQRPMVDTDETESAGSAITVVAAVLTGLAVVMELGVTAWAATYLEDILGFGDAVAAGATVVVLSGLVIGRVLMTRSVGGYRLTDVMLAVMGSVVAASTLYLGGPLLAGSVGTVVSVTGLVLLVLLVSTLFPLGLILTMESAGRNDAQEGASEMAVTAGGLAGITSPFAFATMADAISIQVALIGIPVTALISFLIVLWIRRRLGRPVPCPVI